MAFQARHCAAEVVTGSSLLPGGKQRVNPQHHLFPLAGCLLLPITMAQHEPQNKQWRATA